MTRKFAIAVTLFASLAGTASAGTILDLNTEGDLFSVTDTGTTETIAATSAASQFSFQIPTVLGGAFTTFNGQLTFNASTSTVATNSGGIGGNDSEPGWTGSGQIVCTNCAAPYNNTVVLSFTFGPTGLLNVPDAGTSGTFQDSTPPGTEVMLNSPILSFGNVTSESLSIGFGANNPWSISGGGSTGFITSNTASGVVTFTSNPLPNALPEPATMVMMGSALIGLGLLGRKRFSRPGATK
jgi:hypothetical protein